MKSSYYTYLTRYERTLTQAAKAKKTAMRLREEAIRLECACLESTKYFWLVIVKVGEGPITEDNMIPVPKSTEPLKRSLPGVSKPLFINRNPGNVAVFFSDTVTYLACVNLMWDETDEPFLYSPDNSQSSYYINAFVRKADAKKWLDSLRKQLRKEKREANSDPH